MDDELEKNTGAVTSDEQAPADMDDDSFRDYIMRIRFDGDGADETPPADESDPEPSDSEETEAEEGKEPEAPEGSADPFRSYATEEDWKSDLDAELGKYKAERDTLEKEKYKHYDRLAEVLRFFYGDADDVFGALAEDLEKQRTDKLNADDQDAADAEGKSLEDYREEKRRNEDAQKWRDQEKHRAAADAARDSLVDEWSKDAHKLKLIFPDFDLKEALKVAAFADTLRSGKGVFDAYIASRPAEEKNGTADESAGGAEQESEKHEREPVLQNASSASAGRGNSRTDPSKLSSEDFKKYIDKIRNGF